jgi:apolipoprotein N-acyltransferase
VQFPTRVEWAAAAATAILLILSFPRLELSFLAWIALVPLMVVIAHRPAPARAFLLGWFAGTSFFYVSCYWLTYSMIHYGGLPPVLAYLLLFPGALVVGVFPGVFAFLLALAIKHWGGWAVLLAPVFWPATEWARLIVTGQLWNALGYSQAFHPTFIQPAIWGGVYVVSFLIMTINTAIVVLVTSRGTRAITISGFLVLLVPLAITVSPFFETHTDSSAKSPVTVVALQPNVPMNLEKSNDELNELRERHWSMTVNALKNLPGDNSPRFVIWPESPMNFTYAADRTFQEQLANFTRQNHTSLLFNSLEPTLANGFYNSALLINEDGRLIAQYDKIRLLPFGEYVPLPQWLPGASLITGLVGDFTPGDKYTVMPFGDHRAGTFICIESAYPFIARRLTNEGADVLINISNDGYLGPTAVLRQHLANVIFRAVENGRPVLRVTNTGISARIDASGRIEDQTTPFQRDVRVWQVRPSSIESTFYTRHGDIFVYLCAALTVLVCFAILFSRRSLRQQR